MAPSTARPRSILRGCEDENRLGLCGGRQRRGRAGGRGFAARRIRRRRAAARRHHHSRSRRSTASDGGTHGPCRNASRSSPRASTRAEALVGTHRPARDVAGAGSARRSARSASCSPTGWTSTATATSPCEPTTRRTARCPCQPNSPIRRTASPRHRRTASSRSGCAADCGGRAGARAGAARRLRPRGARHREPDRSPVSAKRARARPTRVRGGLRVRRGAALLLCRGDRAYRSAGPAARRVRGVGLWHRLVRRAKAARSGR